MRTHVEPLGNIGILGQFAHHDKQGDDGVTIGGKGVEKILNDENVDLPALIARQITNRPIYSAYAGERMTTEIHFDNDTSEERTLIEIETEDQIGLLYAVSQTFAELSVDIAGARIVTERGAAIDSFYVRELDGGKIISPERQNFITEKLRAAIERLDIAR